MADLSVRIIPILTDNYVFLVFDTKTLECCVIDPGDPEPTIQAIEELSLRPRLILNTHHHPDHIGGNLTIKSRYKIDLWASAYDQNRIQGVDHTLKGGETISFGEWKIRVSAVPGHTHGHLMYGIPEAKLLFSGDVLFGLGCGRLFEGTAEQLLNSIRQITQLPDDTQIYCSHEYTETNYRFAAPLSPSNTDLKLRGEEIKRLRQANQPTIPLTLKTELKTNPFLRTHDTEIQSSLKMQGASDVEIFTEIRRRRDLHR